ncbi:MAG: hypothetical protein U5K70_02750 [Halodesulfurarchaeum sp.]|nr:hypothetical protein [Halodesulfurarchaeum sp.]
MGVETVECPTCGEAVRFGLPQGSEIRTVTSEATEHTEDGAKTRPLSCSKDHTFAVEFTVG